MVDRPKVFPTSTDKTLLRPFTLDDQQEKALLENDRTIRERLGQPSDLATDIEEFDRHGFGLVAIVDRANGQIVGYGKLQSPGWEKRSGLEIVVAVAPAARRRGFGLDAAQMLIEVACGPLQEASVLGRVAVINPASMRLVNKLGMLKIGERQDLWDGRQYIHEKQCAMNPDNPAAEAGGCAAGWQQQR